MKSNIKSINNYLDNNIRIKVIFTIFLMFLSSFLDALSIGIVIPIITTFVNPDLLSENGLLEKISQFFLIDFKETNINKIVLIFVIIIILSITIRLINLRQSLYLSKLIAANIGSTIFEKIISQSYEEHIKFKSHEIIASMTQKLDIFENMIYHFLIFFSGLLSLITIFILVSLISIKFSLFTIIAFIFFYVTVFLILKKIINNYSIILNNSINSRVKTLNDAMGSLKDIIINFSQKKYSDIFYKYEYTFRITNGKLSFLSMFPRFVLEGLAIILLLTLSLVMIFQYNIDTDEMIIVLGTIVFASQRMLPILSSMYNSWSNFKAQKYVINQVMELLKIKQEYKYIYDNKLSPFTFSEYIELKNISYTYPNLQKKVFSNINLKIKIGEKIAITGKTGSGKSTLIDLIIGLLKPESGEIIIDGKKISNIGFSSWVKNLSHVPQDIFLKNDTIYNNINFMNDNFSEKNIMYAANLADVLEFSNNKKDKIHFVVGDNGKFLSGGQKQRIGLARAFLRNPKILILDEATNQLDKKTEEKIYKNILDNFKNLTLIVITHDKTNLDLFDKIIDISGQRL